MRFRHRIEGVVMTGQVWALLAALGAALSYAGGAVLQQRAALGETVAARRGPWLVVHPLWLTGVALDGAGFLLEFIALRAGSVTLVQPLLVCGLLFSLPLGAVLARRRVHSREIAAGVLVCAGLVVALLAAHPRAGGVRVAAGPWLVGSGITALIVGALLVVARGRPRVVRAVCFAAAAGVVNGLFAGFAKAVGMLWQRGWMAVLTSWPLWALVIAAGLTLGLAAKAFQTGAAAAAITALFAVEPLAGVAVGALLFGDTAHHTPGAVLLEIVGVLACLGGVSLLAGSPAVLAVYAGAEAQRDAPAVLRVRQSHGDRGTASDSLSGTASAAVSPPR